MNTVTDRLKGQNDKFRTSAFMTIKEAFTFLTPVFLIGAFSLAIRCFPITAVREFIETALDGAIFDFLGALYNATYGFAAVYLVFVLAYLNSRTENVHSDIRVISAVSTTICYFASLGSAVLNGDASLISYTNMANIFSALLIAVFLNKLFFLIYTGPLHSKGESCTTTFTRGIHCVPIMCICMATAALSAEIIGLFDGINNFNDLIIVLLAKPFESIGATYIGGLLIMFFESVLWMFGVHGGNVFDSLLTSETGAFAFESGNIMSKPFIDTFVLMGGCGTTLCLFGAILLFSKDSRTRKLTKLAGLPLIFNINEILVFGVPIVFNPIYLVPFVLTPMVSYTVAYIAISCQIVPEIINNSVQWTTPVLVSGYQATGSFAGTLLQLILLVIGTLIYMPFVKRADRIAVENEKKYLDALIDICRKAEEKNQPYRLTNASPILYSFEDNLFTKLNRDIQEGTVEIHYQPQVCDDKIISAEVLLRFKYRDDKTVYPPLVVGIAIERGVFDEMSKVICRQALEDLTRIQKIIPDFKIAVNLGLELLMDEAFRDWMINEVKKSQVTWNSFGIEITEDAKISDADIYQEVFDLMKKSGIEVSMDDFSMGNTSITILQKNYFDFVKIDGSLTGALGNERIRSIVSMIINLGKELNFNVVAEYVETEQQRDQLLAMGCDIFQGYLYYKDMPVEQLLNLLAEQTADGR